LVAMSAPLAFRASVADARCLCSPVGLCLAVRGGFDLGMAALS